MFELLNRLVDLAIAVFAVSSMLSVGFGSRLGDLLAPLQVPGNVFRALGANFVLVPVLAYLVITILPIDQARANALILIASAAGAPFLIKLSEAAGSDIDLTAALLVLLLPVTIIYMPLVVPLLLPGTGVSALAIGTPLLITMLLPLGIGLFIRERWEAVAVRLRPLMGRISTWSLIVLILATVVANYETIVGIGWAAGLGALLVVGGALLIGYVSGGSDPDKREVLGLGTGQRNIAAASVVAAQSLGDATTISMVIATSIVGFAVLFPAAWALRRRERQRHEAVAAAPDR